MIFLWIILRYPFSSLMCFLLVISFWVVWVTLCCAESCFLLCFVLSYTSFVYLLCDYSDVFWMGPANPEQGQSRQWGYGAKFTTLWSFMDLRFLKRTCVIYEWDSWTSLKVLLVKVAFYESSISNVFKYKSQNIFKDEDPHLQKWCVTGCNISTITHYNFYS